MQKQRVREHMQVQISENIHAESIDVKNRIIFVVFVYFSLNPSTFYLNEVFVIEKVNCRIDNFANVFSHLDNAKVSTKMTYRTFKLNVQSCKPFFKNFNLENCHRLQN